MNSLRNLVRVLPAVGLAACTETPIVTGADGSTVAALARVPVVCPTLPVGTSSLLIVPSTVTIGAGATGDLQVTNQAGIGVADCNVKWTSGDTRIATVNATGLVTALKAGGPIAVRATASTKPTLVGSAAVTISPVRVAAVTVPGTSLLVSQTTTLTATVKGADGSPLINRIVRWSSGQPAIATVDSVTGKVTAVALGSATITATSEGVRGTATVTVTPVPVRTVTIDPNGAALLIGQSVQLTATAKDSVGGTLAGRTVTWSSASQTVASVSAQGMVTALSAGTTAITATVEGKTGTVSVTVSAVPVSTVTVAPSSANLLVGQTRQLEAQAKDSIGGSLTGRPVTWTSNSPAIATISNQGLVTATGAGTATLVATVEGKTGSATVTVALVPVRSVTVTPNPGSVAIGQTLQLEASARDSAGGSLTGRPVMWTSETPAIATISPQGVVTGVALGTATIRATVEGVSATATVSVSLPLAPGKPLAVGDRSACALDTNGQAYCWGSLVTAASGTLPTTAPTPVGSPVALATLVAGPNVVCGLSETGAAYCAGSNYAGGTGLGSSSGLTSTFTKIQGSQTFAQLAAGGTHACGLVSSGAIYCWGLNDNGQLGDGTTSGSGTGIASPTAVASGSTLKFVAVTAGGNHTCGLTGTGAAYCWGDNSTGQLGDGTTSDRNTPTAVQGNLIFSQLEAGESDTCGLDMTGVAYCWGANYSGSLGDGTSTQRTAPTRVLGDQLFRSINAGNSFTCGLTTDGSVMCWGDNDRWQLGSRSLIRTSAPSTVTSSMAFGLIDAGKNSTCGLTNSGQIGCWGLNTYGQLGNGDISQRTIPTLVTGAPAFALLTGGHKHTCGRTAQGVTSCWGSSKYGQVGATDSDPKQWSSPTVANTSEAFEQLSSGYWHSCGLNGAGSVYCWGLFNAISPFGTTPSLQAAGKSYLQMVTGWDHICGLLASGGAECWGQNTEGRVGNGTTSNQSAPATVSGGFTFVRLFAGQYRTCGALASGEVYCWGNNNQGALGDSTTVAKSVPTRVRGTGPSLSFLKMAFAQNHSCGIDGAGNLHCWGGAQNGTGSARLTPGQVSLPGPVASVSAGFFHTCATLTSGAAYCWGSNAEGELGRGTNSTSNLPATVSGGMPFTSVAAGQYHTCGITTTGATYCWGENSSGQLGQPIPIGIVSVTGGLTFKSP
jgi:alpha-tubulin suppressor-like RCC1 family protein/uncharacterized protein YjdB